MKELYKELRLNEVEKEAINTRYAAAFALIRSLFPDKDQSMTNIFEPLRLDELEVITNKKNVIVNRLNLLEVNDD